MTAGEHSGWITAKGMTFTTENVPLLIDGTKTNTRRLIKPQPVDGVDPFPFIGPDDRPTGEWGFVHKGFRHVCFAKIKCPHPIGSFVYVRETFLDSSDYPCSSYWDDTENEQRWFYRADATPEESRSVTWKSPRFMPKDAARILLQVTDVRVQRLQDISEGDIFAEGIERCLEDGCGCHRNRFIRLWDSIHKPPHDWAASPWVFAYTLKLVEVRS